MKKLSKAFLLSIFLVISACQVSAQTYSLPGDGKDFFIGFVNPSYNKVAHSAVVEF
jgi:hypothetical protein